MWVWANQEMISKTHERIRYSKEALIPVWQEKEILTSWSHTRFSAALQIQPSFDVRRQILLVRGSLGLLTLLKQIEFDPRKIPRETTWICMLTRRGKLFPKPQTFPGCSRVKKEIPKANLRAVRSLLMWGCELQLGAAFHPQGGCQGHLSNSSPKYKSNQLIPGSLMHWGLIVGEENTKGSPAVQMAQLCPKFRAWAASPRHFQLQSVPQGSPEAPESRAQITADLGKPLCSSTLPSHKPAGPNPGSARWQPRYEEKWRESGWGPESGSQGDSN